MDFRTPAVNTLRVSYEEDLTDEGKILDALAAGGVSVPGRPAAGDVLPEAAPLYR